MTQNQELKFKPHIGLFFRFSVENPTIGKRIYGNNFKEKIKLDPLPDVILVVGEKRNFVRFLNVDGAPYWTRKTHIEPVELPVHAGSPLPVLQKIRKLLIYCTCSRIIEFRTEIMAEMAAGLLPDVDSLIDKYSPKIVPKNK